MSSNNKNVQSEKELISKKDEKGRPGMTSHGHPGWIDDVTRITSPTTSTGTMATDETSRDNSRKMADEVWSTE